MNKIAPPPMEYRHIPSIEHFEKELAEDEKEEMNEAAAKTETTEDVVEEEEV